VKSGRLQGIHARIARLVPGYLAGRVEDVEALRAAHACGDYAEVAAIGHDLRGTGTSYGQAWISAIGEGLEEAARTGDEAAVGRLVHELSEGLARAAEAPGAQGR